MANLQTKMGLENFSFSYYPDFDSYNEEEEKFEEFDQVIEYLKVIKRDFECMISFIDGMEIDFNKSSLLRYLKNIKDSILLDVNEKRLAGYKAPEELLDLKVSDNHIIFSVYDSYNLSYEEKLKKPIRIFMSRSLKDLEFCFIEEVNGQYYVANYRVSKDNITMNSAYITNYKFIDDEFMDKTESCILELKKVLR